MRCKHFREDNCRFTHSHRDTVARPELAKAKTLEERAEIAKKVGYKINIEEVMKKRRECLAKPEGERKVAGAAPKSKAR